jgi:hypothetical protein
VIDIAVIDLLGRYGFGAFLYLIKKSNVALIACFFSEMPINTIIRPLSIAVYFAADCLDGSFSIRQLSLKLVSKTLSAVRKPRVTHLFRCFRGLINGCVDDTTTVIIEHKPGVDSPGLDKWHIVKIHFGYLVIDTDKVCRYK